MAPLPFLPNEASRAFGSRPALITADHSFSYEQYAGLVSATAHKLPLAGINPGQRLAFYLSNQWQYAIALMACLHQRIPAVLFSPKLPPARVKELAQRLNCKMLVLAGHASASDDFGNLRVVNISSFCAGATETSAAHLKASLPADQPATLIFTSGSTGTPKAALLSYGNHYFSALGANRNLPFGPGDRWLLSLPLYHVGGLAILFRAALGGGAVVFPENPRDLAGAIAKYRVTHVSLVATQLYRLLQDPAAAKPLAQLKAILIGGSAIPKSLIDRAVELGLPIHTTYGLTEMASQVTTTPPGASREMLATSGRCLPHRQLDISPEGEIRVKGRTRFLGYVDGDKLVQPFDAQGWFATGDLGYM
ncbi:MAG: o-succinylbenzoate--CoA ligase, partial [Calditrichaeota bacterium]